MMSKRNAMSAVSLGWDMFSGRRALGNSTRRHIMAVLRMSSACVIFGRQRCIGALGHASPARPRFTLSAITLLSIPALGGISPVAANTLDDGTQVCTSGGAIIGNESNQGTVIEPVDGSGNLSIVGGCSASGNNQLAVTVLGVHADARGAGAVAVGYNADAVKWASAFGLDTNAAGSGSVALGFSAVSTGSNAVAIGSAGGDGTTPLSVANSTTASGAGSVAIGSNGTRGAQAGGADSIALGGEATVGSGTTSGIAIGRGASVTGLRSIAQGDGASASAEDQITIGTDARAAASSPGAIAIGAAAEALGADGVAIGSGVGAGTIGQNVAIGSGSTFANGATMSEGAVAIGSGQQAEGDGAVAIGAANVATGNGSVVIGRASGATGPGALAFGDSTNADANRAVALGTTSEATSDSAIAIGNGATGQNGVGATAIGRLANADGDGTIAIGNSALASAGGAVALGDGAVASGVGSIVLGDATADGFGAIALGTGAQASGGNAISIGVGNVVSGDGSGAIGDPTTITGEGSYSLGNDNMIDADEAGVFGNDNVLAATAAGSRIIGNGNDVDVADAFVIGNGADVTVAGGVAIGSGSVSRTLAGSAGYDPLTGALSTDATATWQSTASALSVGDASNGVTRQITGVAAGTEQTDAVNVAQLQALQQAVTTHYLSVNDRGIAEANYDNDGATGLSSIAIGVGASTDADAAIAVGNGATVTSSYGSIAMGDGIHVNGGNNNTVIGSLSHVTEQTPGTFALNNSLIGTYNQVYDGGGNVIVGVGSTIEGGDENVIIGSALMQGGTDRSVSIGNNNSVNSNNVFAIGNDLNIGMGVDGAVALGASTGVAVEDGVALGSRSRATTGAGMAGYNPLTGLPSTETGGAWVSTLGAVSVGGNGRTRQITNVAAGTEDTDVVNVAQLKALGDAMAAGQAHYYSVNSSATGSGSNYDNDGATGTNALAAGVNAAASGTSGTAVGFGSDAAGMESVALGSSASASALRSTAVGVLANASGIQSVAMGSGATALDTNAIALGSDAIANNSDDVALGSGSVTGTVVATTSTTINGTTYAFAGSAPASTVSVGDVGAERTITNVAAGRIDSNSTDAINGSQLFATNQAVEAATMVANTGWNIQANGDVGSKVAPGDTVEFVDGQNIEITRLGGQLTVATSADLFVDSVTAGGTVLDVTGLTIAGGPSVTSTGIDAGNMALAHVAPGAVNATSTDAVNGAQLFATNEHVAQNTTDIANLDGRITAVEGDVTSLGNTIVNLAGDTSGAYTDANGAGIRYARTNEAGLPETDAFAQGVGSTALGYQAAAAADAAVALGRDAQANIDGSLALGAGSVADRAIAPTSGTLPAGIGFVPFNTADATLLGGVSVGNAATGEYRQITNVADGTEAQDVVTLRQLQGAISSVSVTPVQYFHANSSAADSLAAGSESIAVGPATVVNGDNGIGIGNGAIVQMTAPGGTAIGQNAQVSQADGIALGTNSVADGIQSIAIGPGANASFSGSVALGAGATTSVGSQTGYTAYGLTELQNSAGEVSVGSAGTERKVTNVAAGSAPTDAVNVSQLQSVVGSVNVGFAGNSGNTIVRTTGQVLAIQGAGTTAGTYSGGNIRTETDPATGSVNILMADAPKFGTVTVNDGGTGKIAGVAAATLSSTSTDAVNGSQLVALGNSIAASISLGSTYDPATNSINTQIVIGGSVYNNIEAAIRAAGNNATGNTPGAGWSVTTTSTGSGVVTNSSVTNVPESGTATFTAGNNMMIHQNGSEVQVALNPNLTGIESIAVTGGPTINGNGIDMGGDRITNVGAGTAPTDAVNLGQLNNGLANTLGQANMYTDSAISDLRFDLSRLHRDANGGTASAMAMGTVPQAFEPGMGIMGLGVAHWQGEQAFAIGFSKASDDGRIVIRASGTYNTRNQAGAAVGVGFQF